MKKNSSAVIYFVLILSLSITFSGCVTSPDFEKTAEPVPQTFTVKAMPIFVLPEADKKNGIKAVFFDNTGSHILSVTVVFADEDHPSAFKDFIYDIYRRFKYKRTEDVETFEYHYAKQSEIKNGFPAEVVFPTTYSKNQIFFTKDVKHYSETVRFSSFTLRGNRPLIFINTWNHLFSENNNNRNLKLQIIDKYPVFRGSRADVEALYRGR